MTELNDPFDDEVRLWREIQTILATLPPDQQRGYLDKLADGAELAPLLAEMRDAE